MLLQILYGVLITAENVVGEAVDLDVATDWQISGSNELVVFVYILVLVATEERTFNDAGVLHSGLVDRDAIVTQVE